VELLEILILAVVQGITEFLPVSSSGHLVIVERLLGHTENLLTVNIALHAGTLLSIMVFYWHRIWRLLSADRRAVGLILLATIPVVLVGLPLKKYGEWLLEDALVAGCLLPVTGLMLIWISRRPTGTLDYPQMSYRSALVVGLFQAIAPLPGISRSGATITGGLAMGLRRDAAATFAFLLGIPAIGGASLLTLIKLLRETPGDATLATPLGYLAIGFVVSFIVGLFALWWLLRWLEKGRLEWFAYWCIAVGIIIVVWQLSIGAA
jgi:undecaprenyl-diphosphatase